MHGPKKLAILITIVAALGCSKKEAGENIEQAKEGTKSAVNKVADALEVEAPFDKQPADAKAREAERFNEEWRQLESFRQTGATPAAQQQGPEAPKPPEGFRFVANAKETLKGLDADAINSAPVSVPIKGDVSGPSVLKTQVYLDRAHFSVGAIDGRWGRNSAIAVWWYQRSRALPATGAVDEATFRALAAGSAYAPALVRHQITEEDAKGPFVEIPEDVYDKEKLDCLCYESVKEKLAERFHIAQDFLDALNPNASYRAGETIVVPNVRPPHEGTQPDIVRAVVSIAGSTFSGYDASGRLIFHAPTTLGSKYDPSPRETVSVKKIVENPHFHYQPTLFHEVPDTDPEAHLKPGPNSPVGVVWIALSKPHYGVHGTSDPESIGYASSHGCVRLTNWDAREVAKRIGEGVEIAFSDTRKKKETQTASR